MNNLQENEAAQKEEDSTPNKEAVSHENIKDENENLIEKENTQEEEREDYKEKYYYLAAELDNLRKRHERERENLLKYGTERMVKGLLEVVDSLERGLETIRDDADEKVKNIYAGMEMVNKQFLDVLEINGLELVESLGKMFDPNFHEAMGHREADGKEDGEIVVEYQKGYLLNGRLIRPSKVVIVKNNSKKGEN